MNLPISVTQNELSEILLNIAPTCPVFIWGAPGIGKSALVEQFASAVGLPCVSLLGSQLAPEDIIGIPRINGETSEFMPPKMIARKDPYVLFLDELNACSQDLLFPDSGENDRRIPSAKRLRHHRCRKPLTGRCDRKDHVHGADQPDVSCGAASERLTVADVGI